MNERNKLVKIVEELNIYYKPLDIGYLRLEFNRETARVCIKANKSTYDVPWVFGIDWLDYKDLRVRLEQLSIGIYIMDKRI